MKRFMICLLLFAFVLAVSFSGTAALQKNAAALQQALQQTVYLAANKESRAALAAAKKSAALWEKDKNCFFLFLDHESFSELAVLMQNLSDIVSLDADNAPQQIFPCIGILRELQRRERLTLGNIL